MRRFWVVGLSFFLLFPIPALASAGTTCSTESECNALLANSKTSVQVLRGELATLNSNTRAASAAALLCKAMDASTTALAEAKTSCSNSATDASLRAAEAAEKKGAELQEAVDRQAEIAAQLFKINTANSALNEAKAAADKAAADKAAADKAAADNAAADNAAYEIRLMAAKSKYSALSLEIESLLKRYPSKKSEIELYKKKITLFERIDQVNISTVELNLAGIESKLDAMKSIYSKIARTITCTKGKKSLKVLDVNPKCPAGYKKK